MADARLDEVTLPWALSYVLANLTLAVVIVEGFVLAPQHSPTVMVVTAGVLSAVTLSIWTVGTVRFAGQVE